MKTAPIDRGLHVSLDRAMQAHPEAGNLAAAMARVRGAEIEYYAPVSVDLQKPHARDELYVIAAGSGTFTAADESVSCTAGDVLFVPARVEHRFSGFSDDFATWVIFYGPEYPE